MQKLIVIEDGTGSEVLQQLNNAFESIATNFMGSSEPEKTYPSMSWIDTSGAFPVKKQRNTDDSEWIVLGEFKEGVFYNADRAFIETKTITLGTTWNGTNAPYSQTVEVEGLLASDVPIVGLIQSGTYTAAQTQLTDYAKIYRAVTSNGAITFYANESTSTTLTLQLKIIR